MNVRLLAGLVVVATIVLGWVLFHKDPSELELTESGIKEYRLSNGMKVIVVENHRAPVVVSQVWYRIGASYEHDGITGVSHVLEHMMFKGTSKHPAGEFSEIVAANGGEENAFTGRDFTAYFQKIAKDRLELCLELEADRMRNLTFSEEEFLKEIEVVKEERRLRTDDKPTALTYERFNAVAYTNNPYRQPIIGWMEDLDTMTVEDARQWYETWYAPNNATLVVAGDVAGDDVYQLAKQYFGQYPASHIPQLKPRREAKQYGTQRVSVEVPAKVPYLIMGYKTPVLTPDKVDAEDEWEMYALEVLAGVLDGGNSARLSNNLVRGQQIANSASAGYSMSARHESMFTLTAVPNDDVAVDVLEFALREVVNTIRTQPPGEDELERVKAQVVASQVYQQDSIFYQAMEIGMLDTIGLPWKLKDGYVEKILAVSADQVRQVAEKYLTDDRLTVAVLDPLPIENGDDQTQAVNNHAGEGHAH